MTNKPQTERQLAHMYFKQRKAGMPVSPENMVLVRRYYSFINQDEEVR